VKSTTAGIACCLAFAVSLDLQAQGLSNRPVTSSPCNSVCQAWIELTAVQLGSQPRDKNKTVSKLTSSPSRFTHQPQPRKNVGTTNRTVSRHLEANAALASRHNRQESQGAPTPSPVISENPAQLVEQTPTGSISRSAPSGSIVKGQEHSSTLEEAEAAGSKPAKTDAAKSDDNKPDAANPSTASAEPSNSTYGSASKRAIGSAPAEPAQSSTTTSAAPAEIAALQNGKAAVESKEALLPMPRPAPRPMLTLPGFPPPVAEAPSAQKGAAPSSTVLTVDEFFVVQDTVTKKCAVVDKKPEANAIVTVVSPSGTVYKTRTEAEATMKAIKVCSST
jgi:hypothetical protein